MLNTLRQYINNLAVPRDQYHIASMLFPIGDRVSTVPLNSAGLAIKTGGSALVKTGASAFYAMVNAVLVKIAAATDMPALSGTVTNATFNVFAFFVDSGGTVTGAMGTAGATIGAVKFPAFPEQKALIGFIIVNPTGTGDFVGGTTALDDATVVPNVVYINGLPGFDPSVILK